MKKQYAVMMPLFLIAIMLMPSAPVQADSVAPAEERRLVQDVEMWSRVVYDDANALLSTPMEANYFSLDATVRDNDTLPAVFDTSAGSAEDTQVSDLNITGGIGYSDDGFSFFTPEPTGYEADSQSALAKQIGLLSEPEIPEFDTEADRQYVTYEPSGTFREIQTDLAASLPGGRSNTYDAVNISDVYVRVDIDYDLMNEMLQKVVNDDRWDPDDGMTDNEIISVLADYIFEYSHGMMLGIGNQTTIQAVSGQDNWDLSQEVVATLSNDTDANLNGFTSDSLHLYLGIISYIMEFGYTDATASMVATGIFGEVPSFRRGIFEGLSIAQTEEGTVYQQWLNLDTFSIFSDNNFLDDIKIIFSEFMDYEAVLEAQANYSGTIWFLTFIFFWIAVALLTEGGWLPINFFYYIKGMRGKGAKRVPAKELTTGWGRRTAQMVVLFGIVWYVTAFFVRSTLGVA